MRLLSCHVWNRELHRWQLRWRWSTARRNSQLTHAGISWVADFDSCREISLRCVVVSNNGLLCAVRVWRADVPAVGMVGYASFLVGVGGYLVSLRRQVQIYVLWICVLVCEAVGSQTKRAGTHVVELVSRFAGGWDVWVVLGWSSLRRFVYISERDRCQHFLAYLRSFAALGIWTPVARQRLLCWGGSGSRHITAGVPAGLIWLPVSVVRSTPTSLRPRDISLQEVLSRIPSSRLGVSTRVHLRSGALLHGDLLNIRIYFHASLLHITPTVLRRWFVRRQ